MGVLQKVSSPLAGEGQGHPSPIEGEGSFFFAGFVTHGNPGRTKVMTKIYLPAILPYFFSGARLAFAFGWRVSLVAETLGASSGVGYRLRQSADLIQTDQVFAWTITMIAMMATLEMGAFRPLENHLFRWKKEAESS